MVVVNEYTYGKYVVELTVEETEIVEKMSPNRSCPRNNTLRTLLEKALTKFVKVHRRDG